MTKIISASFCDVSTAVKRCFALMALSFICISSSYGQLEDLSISNAVQSGHIQEIDATHEVGIIQFIIVDLDSDKAKLIKKELTNYSGEIIGYGQAVIDGKIIVSYTSPIYPNFLLAILDRVNIKGFYDQGGTEVYYIKDGKSAFIR